MLRMVRFLAWAMVITYGKLITRSKFYIQDFGMFSSEEPGTDVSCSWSLKLYLA